MVGFPLVPLPRVLLGGGTFYGTPRPWEGLAVGRKAAMKTFRPGAWERQPPPKANQGERRDHRKRRITQTDMGVRVEWACEGRQTEDAEDRWGRQVSEGGREGQKGTGREAEAEGDTRSGGG